MKEECILQVPFCKFIFHIMGRVQLELPDQFIFSTVLEVRGADLNYGGHVGNDRILGLMQEARIRFYRSVGFKDELHFDGSVGHVIADAVVIYKSESFLGDQLEIQIGISGITRYAFDMYYLIINQNSKKEIARGKTGMVCFDYDKRKVAPIPEVLLKNLKGD